jgi:ribonucleoside-diphosphate reductase alpha chain
MQLGPENLFSQHLHQIKYRGDGESYDDYAVRYARTLADDERHFRHLLAATREQRLLPGGRQQLAIGRPYQTTAFSCFTGGVIPDSMNGIMEELHDSAMTLRSGGGCGWDFSTLRPDGDPIRGLGPGARASGPVGFMPLWNAMCSAIMSAGMRRGAMMSVLRCDHPDILKFIRAKRQPGALTNFNISVGCSNAFMEAVERDGLYDLMFEGRVYQSVRALDVWAVIMESNWDWAEPGVLFLDRINDMNPLAYCEKIYTTNPCSEQPLPPHGACLLGSLNLVKYLVPSYARGFDGGVLVNGSRYVKGYELDMDLFARDVAAAVRAFDNVIENTTFPLPEQEKEARDKRRMGLGVTGVANALEVCGHVYGTPGYLQAQETVLAVLRDTAYETSIQLAQEKGAFPLFDADGWLASGFALTLPEPIRERIRRYGLRNGLLLSIAPTGTISLTADNVSSGIEPPPFLETTRKVNLPEGLVEVELQDYALAKYGVRCRTAVECSPQDHIRVLCNAQRFIDSSTSKTCNVKGTRGSRDPEPGEITFAEFKDLYLLAWEGGAKGCTTYNVNGKREGIIVERKTQATSGSGAGPGNLYKKTIELFNADPGKDVDSMLATEDFRAQGRDPLEAASYAEQQVGRQETVADIRQGAACFVDPQTGMRTCDE